MKFILVTLLTAAATAAPIRADPNSPTVTQWCTSGNNYAFLMNQFNSYSGYIIQDCVRDIPVGGSCHVSCGESVVIDSTGGPGRMVCNADGQLKMTGNFVCTILGKDGHAPHPYPPGPRAYPHGNYKW
jgi:hypothetical protein